MSQADLTLQRHSTAMAEPAFSVPAKKMAMWLFIIADSATFAGCLSMLIGVRSAENGDRSKAFRWTMITAACGIMFAALHIREWVGMIGEGVALFHNPWGTPLFGSLFFSITGLHLLHVTGGVVALIAVGLRYQGGRYNADDLEITGLYWHFVDLVWMFVVPFVYLMNLAH